MKAKQFMSILICCITIISCKDYKPPSPNEGSTEINSINKSDSKTNLTFYKKPNSCLSLFETLDFSELCLQKNTLNTKEYSTTEKGCNLAIYSKKLNGGELDISIYYESDPTKIEQFKLITEVQKTMIPNSTFKNVKELGSSTFIVHRSMLNTKVMVMSINNVRVIIQSKRKKKNTHCMYTDNQLIKIAKEIAKNIH